MIPCPRARCSSPAAVIIMQVQLAHETSQHLQPLLKIAAAKGLQMTDIQAQTNIGSLQSGKQLFDQFRLGLIDIFQMLINNHSWAACAARGSQVATL